MNRPAIALALLATSAAAAAQTTSSVYGVIDTAVAHGSGSLTSKSMLTSGGNMTSRLGFRGTSNLGDGFGLTWFLEAQVFADSGEGQATNTNNQTTGTSTATAGSQGLTFARRSTISLTGGFGELRLGRDFMSHYRNRVEVDPFGNAGVGAIQPFAGSIGGPVSTRASNMVGYYLPSDLGGLYGQVQYIIGENLSGTATSGDGKGASIRLGYKQGPFNVSLAYGRTAYATTATAGNITTQNLGVQYDFGFLRLMGGLYRDEVARTAPVKATGFSLGGIVPIGRHDIKFAASAYGTDAGLEPETRKISLGYVFNVNKETALYATLAQVSNAGGATTALNQSTTAADTKSKGYDFGIRHMF